MLPGDAYLDGMVDSADATILIGNWRVGGVMFFEDADFDCEGTISTADYTITATRHSRKR